MSGRAHLALLVAGATGIALGGLLWVRAGPAIWIVGLAGWCG